MELPASRWLSFTSSNSSVLSLKAATGTHFLTRLETVCIVRTIAELSSQVELSGIGRKALTSYTPHTYSLPLAGTKGWWRMSSAAAA